MKRLWFIAVIAAGMTACVEGNNPVQLLDAVPRDPSTCDRADASIIRGRLNFSVGDSYRVTFSLFSPLIVDESNETTTPAGFYADEIVLSYETRNPKITLDPESRPIYAVVNAGADPTESWIAVDLIGTEARKKLATAVPTAPDAMTLLSTIKLKGKLPSGKSVETNEATYPIEISRGPGCPADTVPTFYSAEAPCGFPGQDGYYSLFSCVAAPATGG